MSKAIARSEALSRMRERVQLGGDPPRFHGNGFGQFYLDDNRTRFHVWSAGLSAIQNHNATIHSHTYDVTSEVLLGEIVHRTHLARACPYREATHSLFYLEQWGPDPKRKARPEEHGTPCVLKRTGEYRMQEGASYFFARNELHETERGENMLAATMFCRHLADDDDPQPFVIAPRDERPVDAFGDFAPSTDRLWTLISDALGLMPLANVIKVRDAIRMPQG